jgi:hypothetical protein
MTTLIKVWILSLVNTMLSRQREELKVAEGNTCSCSHPIWKLASRTMMAKVFWTTSWVPVCSLPWAQCKMWIPIRSMGWVCTHQGRPTIEGCGSPSYIWSVMEKIREDNWRAGKIGWAISQMPAPSPKHDNIRT